MLQTCTSDHVLEDGKPAGGETYADVGVPGEEGYWRILYVKWQDGPLGRGKQRQEPNGLFVETLIKAAADRIEFYERTQFACEENAQALAHLNEALRWLESRTARREKDGVEGTHEGS